MRNGPSNISNNKFLLHQMRNEKISFLIWWRRLDLRNTMISLFDYTGVVQFFILVLSTCVIMTFSTNDFLHNLYIAAMNLSNLDNNQADKKRHRNNDGQWILYYVFILQYCSVIRTETSSAYKRDFFGDHALDKRSITVGADSPMNIYT